MSRTLRKSKNKSTSISGDLFDIAVIGAGFAGLSAALVLGRYLLSAVVFDGGTIRNHRTRHVHSYLGMENISPKRLINQARRNVLLYDSVSITEQQVTEIKNNKEHFLITTDKNQVPVKAKYIIIATGVVDTKPDIKNFMKIDGKGAWHCPHCDGLESAGKSLTILANGKYIGSSAGAISYAKEFIGWTNRIRVFIQDNYPLDQEQRLEAKRLSIKVIENDPLVEVLIFNRSSGKIKLLSNSGKVYNSDVVFYNLGCNVQNNLAKQLGCELEEDFIKVDKRQQTSVPRVFAAGDVDTDRHYVALAVAGGALAAISIYEDILKRT